MTGSERRPDEREHVLEGEAAERFAERMKNPKFSQKRADVLAEAKRKVTRLG